MAEHDLIWYENRRTPEVVPRGGAGKKGGPNTAAGRVIKRRAATADEEKQIAKGGWLRLTPSGKKPSDPNYKSDKKSKIRPKFN